MTVSIGSEKSTRLLVLGVIDQPVRDMIHYGTTIGWSIYACNEVEGAQGTADVHWLHPEYFEKISGRDAPEFNALLIAPSLAGLGAIDRMVEKFRVRRIAVIQLVSFTDRSNVDDAEKLLDSTLYQETLAGDDMKDSLWNGETRLFLLPAEKLGEEGHAAGAEWGNTIHDCFSWLSK